MTTLLITCPPTSHQATQALNFAKNLIAQGKSLQLFFYGNGVYVANRLRWQPANTANIASEWIALAQSAELALPVCVSSALARGITDTKNAARHQLSGDNLLPPFYLTGLGDLVAMLESENGKKSVLVQF